MPAIVMQKVDITSNTPEITFSNISGFDDLLFVLTLRSNQTGNATDRVAVRFNDIATGFTSIETFARYSNAQTITDQTSTVATNEVVGGRCPNDAATTGFYGVSRMLIPSYSESGWLKCVMTEYKHVESSSLETRFGRVGTTWGSTVPISTVTLYPMGGSAWVAGSVATLYGLKAA